MNKEIDNTRTRDKLLDELVELRRRFSELESRQRTGLPDDTADTQGMLFSRIFTHSMHPIITLDSEGKILDFNPATALSIGIGMDELRGIDITSLMSEASEVKLFRVVLEKARMENICPRIDFSVFGKDQQPVRILADILPVIESEERSSRFIMVCADMTEQERARQALNECEERYLRLLEISSEAIAVSKDGLIIDANVGFASMTGRNKSELIGMSIEELGEGGLGESLVSIFDQTDDPGESGRTVELGSSIMMVARSENIPYDGEIATLAAIRDVTDIRKTEEALRGSEERFRAVFEAAPDCVFIKNRDLRFTEVNPSMEKLFGLPASEIIGLRSEDLYGPEASRKITEWDRRVLEGETIEEEHTRPYKGHFSTFLDVRAPVRDGQGNIIGICGICRDITERKRAIPVTRPGDLAYPSKAMREIMEHVARIASTDGTVLLQGESGTGKDYLAQWIHDHSPRSDSPFFSVNCAALPHELAESELFGHEAAAFTGARGRKKGLLELAEGGTLLLNEVGELSTALQSKLLTFLDTMTFLRVGGQRPVHVDARIIAATHRDLMIELSEGRFLEPLFYRLNVFPVRVPPLRERLEDIPILSGDLMRLVASEINLAKIPELDAGDVEALKCYHWPGNVRELRNLLERSLMLWAGGKIELVLPVKNMETEEYGFKTSLSSGKTLREVSDELIHALCRETLRFTGGNKRKAARMLGISRDSLYRYIERFNIMS
jgi:PAS domain S-box-containing protein